MFYLFRFRFRLPGFTERPRISTLLKLLRFQTKMTTETVIDKRIPDKWRDYEPCGVPIRGERIIAFKTPLSKRYDNESDRDNGLTQTERFTPMDLLRHLDKTGVTLGAVVDFTNTGRYYDGREFTERGIKYRKIKCVGKEIPSEQVVQRFKAEVCTFLANNATGAHVGVHCTHGLNRAGYVVCRYLIECKGYKPERAIEAFNRARGYPMERDNYLEDLRLRTPKFDDTSRVESEAYTGRIPAPPHTSRHYHTGTDSLATQYRTQDRTSWVQSHWRDRNERLDYEPGYNNYYTDHYHSTDRRNETRSYNLRRQPIRGRDGQNNHSYDNYSGYDNYDNYSNYGNYDNYSSGYHDHRPERSYRQDHVTRHEGPYRDRPKPYSRHRTR